MVATRDQVAQRIEAFWPLVDQAAVGQRVAQSWIQAIIHQESGGDPEAFRVEPAVGDASFGLMQLLLKTARGLGFTGPPRQLFDPTINIDLGTRYFAGLARKYQDPAIALVHYNGGPAAAARYRQGRRDFPAARYSAKVQALRTLYVAWNQQRGRG